MSESLKSDQNYKNRWFLIGIPVSVFIATFVGTPHTLWDGILYLKMGLNLFIGVAVWFLYYQLVKIFDQKMPWGSVNQVRRWAIQLGLSIPIGAALEFLLTYWRNEFISFPFSFHLYFYTDLPIFIFLSIAIQYIYYRWYQRGLEPEAKPQVMDVESSEYKDQLTVKRGRKTYLVSIDEVAYFYRKNQFNYLKKWTGEEMMIDQSLAILEKKLAPQEFFRINRQLLVNRKSIEQFNVLPSRQTALELTPNFEGEALLNKNRSAEFKKWLQS